MPDGFGSSTAHSVFTTGLVFTVAYVLLGSAAELYAAAVFQTTDIHTILLIAFALVAIVFNILPRPKLPRLDRRVLGGFAALNIATAVSWIGLFFGLAHVEPAIVVSFIVAVGPVATVVLDRAIRGTRPSVPDIVASLAIASTGVYLAYVSLSGNAAMAWSAWTAVGIGASIAAGFSMSVTGIFVRRLYDLDVDGRGILAHRFYGALVIVAILVDPGEFAEVVRTSAIDALLIALGTIIVPIMLIQAGMRRLQPIVVQMVLTVSPLVTFVMQAADPRLAFSPYTLAGNVVIVAIALWCVHAHSRRVS
ncbi:MAG: EamA family transporter [Salinarimonas sp.]